MKLTGIFFQLATKSCKLEPIPKVAKLFCQWLGGDRPWWRRWLWFNIVFLLWYDTKSLYCSSQLKYSFLIVSSSSSEKFLPSREANLAHPNNELTTQPKSVISPPIRYPEMALWAMCPFLSSWSLLTWTMDYYGPLVYQGPILDNKFCHNTIAAWFWCMK